MLTAGSRIGYYEVVGLLGAGGMGEVYRARDTKLNRDVAIKVLPDVLATDPERLARFHREAQVLASLNHPNIAHIHGYEEANGIHALVMELVEGATLADRIARGALPLDEALPIAKQIADALEAAHEQGIIHRDLKPANIKVRDDGTVKVLDFGLAKLVESAPGASSNANVTASPTITSPALMTGTGVILGTAAYMSPEQAKGRPADRRSDLWAFGCVLYEMLAAVRAFPGDDLSETLATVIKSDPDWSALPAETPVAIRRLLKRCLTKDRAARIADASIIRIEIDDARQEAAAAPMSPLPRTSQPRARMAWTAAALSGALFLVAAALAARVYFSRPVDSHVYRSILPPRFSRSAPASRLALSPDGRRLAFAMQGDAGQSPVAFNGLGGAMLWVRSLDGLSEQSLAGTEGASAPFWSPDSRSVAFIAGGKLKRIDASGGPVITICDVGPGNPSPGTWNSDDVILFSRPASSNLLRVSATSSATPLAVTMLDEAAGETSHAYPFFLPDGRHFLYVALSGTSPLGVYAGSLDSKERTRLIEGGSNAQYARGALLFIRETTLMAQPFDPDRLTLSGAATPLAERVRLNAAAALAGAFTVSEAGVLVYQSGNFGNDQQLTWFDRTGKTLSLLGSRADYRDVQISPDGLSVSVSLMDSQNRYDIWRFDISRGVPTRVTTDPGDEFAALWQPGGTDVVFSARRKGHLDLFRMTAERSGEPETLLEDSTDKFAMSWSPNGRFLLYTVTGAPTGGDDIWALPLTPGGKAIPLANARFQERFAQFSPDGRWIAYTSNESGQEEVYVMPFVQEDAEAGRASRQTGERTRLSVAGGTQPRWGRGKEILYLTANGKLMTAAISTDQGRPAVGDVRPLFDLLVAGGARRYLYDVSPDGRKILADVIDPQTAAEPLTLVVNWPALLKR